MKQATGDKVKVRTWDSMVEQYGMLRNNCIDIPEVGFIENMKKFCGKYVTISECYDTEYGIKEDDEDWIWTDDMFEEGNKND